MYAGTYQRRRHVGQMIGGGPDGGIFKTKDAGKTWTKLTNGLPKHDVGRIALATDPRKPRQRVRDHQLGEHGARLLRSDDQGATWKKLIELPRRRSGLLLRDLHRPVAPDTIWSVNTPLEWSRDGGKTFTAVPNMASDRRSAGAQRRANQYVHVDFHDVTFDPADRNHILIGKRRRAVRDVRRRSPRRSAQGAHWRFFTNLPITQFYRVSVDNAQPFYHVCGGAQDNFSVCGPSRTNYRFGIRPTDWVIRQQRRRIPDALGSRGSEHRLRPVAGRQHHRATICARARRKSIRPRGVAAPAAAGRRRAERGRRRTRPARRAGRGRSRSRSASPAAPGRPVRGAAAGRRRGGGGGFGAPGGDRPNWDAPYIISPHLAHAPLLGQPISLSLRRSRRQLDAHQPRSDAQSRLADAADHGQGVAARRLRGRAAHVHDGAQQRSCRSTSRRCSKA